MGSSESSQEAPLELPQQRIVSVVDGHVNPAAAGAAGGAAGAALVGSAQEAVPVRAPFSLVRGGLRLEARGGLRAEISASVGGTLEVLAPALERTVPGQWPAVTVEGGGPSVRHAFDTGRSVVQLQLPSGLAAGGDATVAAEDLSNGHRRWPAILVLWPGSPPEGAGIPPDGAVMVCCGLRRGQLEASRQLIAWGGAGAAYVVRELYGIQEVRAPGGGQGDGGAEADNQRNCVVCLTATKDTALMPCGHFCVCFECGASLRLAPARNRCPLCRQEVHDITRIDFSSQVDEASPAADSGAAVEASPAEGPPPEGAAGAEGGDGAEVPARAAAEEPSRASGSEAASGGLPPRCLQRLTREMRQIEQQREKHLEEHGLELSLTDPEGGDLRTWSLRIATGAIDEACDLGKALRGSGVGAIEFELWVPDAFPVQPPRVRVIKPCFNPGSFFVFHHGALCLEILTTQGWTPAMSLPQLGVQVKTMMSQGHGTVASGGLMGDPGPSGRDSAWSTFQRIESGHSDWKMFSSA